MLKRKYVPYMHQHIFTMVCYDSSYIKVKRLNISGKSGIKQTVSFSFLQQIATPVVFLTVWNSAKLGEWCTEFLKESSLRCWFQRPQNKIKTCQQHNYSCTLIKLQWSVEENYILLQSRVVAVLASSLDFHAIIVFDTSLSKYIHVVMLDSLTWVI